MTRHQAQGTHASSILTVSVDVADAVTLTPAEQARLSHQLSLVLASLQRRYIRYVLEHDERLRVLRKLTAREAEVIGVLAEWRKAQMEGRSQEAKAS